MARADNIGYIRKCGIQNRQRGAGASLLAYKEAKQWQKYEMMVIIMQL